MATTKRETFTCEICGREVTLDVTYLASGDVLEDVHTCPHGKICGRIGARLDCSKCEEMN